MTICPCCGFKSASVISYVSGDGCQSCGASPVGEPLPRPAHELPSFGRSLVLASFGTLLVLLFVAQTIGSFLQKVPTAKTTKETFYAAGAVALDFGSWVSAAQTAAWQLKWLMIPVTLLVIFGIGKLYRSIVNSPAQYCGLGAARRGYIAAAAVPLLVAILIGVTVPERLRHRQWGIDAGIRAHAYRVDRAYADYQKKFETLPSHLGDLKRLPDPDGTLAAALLTLDENGYRPSAELAAAPSKKPRQLRGAVIMNASSDAADDLPSERISFTNYELQMPGPDKLLGTEDDLMMRDGLITQASDSPRRLDSTTTTRPIVKR